MTKDYYSGDIHIDEGGDDDDLYDGALGPEIELPVGTVIEDRYEIIEYLGNGTSAVVYKCIDRLLGNLIVAMKVMPADVVEDPVATTRLYRELLTNFDFDHENIASPFGTLCICCRLVGTVRCTRRLGAGRCRGHAGVGCG